MARTAAQLSLVGLAALVVMLAAGAVVASNKSSGSDELKAFKSTFKVNMTVEPSMYNNGQLTETFHVSFHNTSTKYTFRHVRLQALVGVGGKSLSFPDVPRYKTFAPGSHLKATLEVPPPAKLKKICGLARAQLKNNAGRQLWWYKRCISTVFKSS